MADTQHTESTPPERPRLFGLRRETRGWTAEPGGYDEKYEDDALGEELGEDARIWRVMLDEARIEDSAMLRRFRDHLDVNLVFSGLFSAVVTTFVVQTSQPSEDAMSVALLSELIAVQRASANHQPVNNVPATNSAAFPAPSPWINRFWFLSLVFSLSAAFGAVVVRQWLQRYESDITGSRKRRALVRHYRYVGLMKWKVHLIIPALPMLLHVSLLLFFLGLILYVRQSDPSMAQGIMALTVFIYLLYLTTNLLPVYYPQCPYRSPLSTGAHYVKSLFDWAWSHVGLTSKRLRSVRHGLLDYCIRRPHDWCVDKMMCFLLRFVPVRDLYALLCVWRRAWTSLQLARDFLEDDVYFHWKLRWREWVARWTPDWKAILRTPRDHEWASVSRSLDDIVPNSLVWAAHASPDLSVSRLVVQASSGIMCTDEHEGYNPLMWDCVFPWFINAMDTRRTVLDWAPGREVELQRMACALLLVSETPKVSSETDHRRHKPCARYLLASLTRAMTSTTGSEVNKWALSVTIIALANYLSHDTRHWNIDTVEVAITSLATLNDQSTALRLHPVIWEHALEFLMIHTSLYFRSDKHDYLLFAITLWRAFDPEPTGQHKGLYIATSSYMTLKETLEHWRDLEWAQGLVSDLVCKKFCEHCNSCDTFRNTSERSEVNDQHDLLHTASHAIDLYIDEDHIARNADFNENLGFLAEKFVSLLVSSYKYTSIELALRKLGYLAASTLLQSTFLAHNDIPLAQSVKVEGKMSTSVAVSLFWFLLRLASSFFSSIEDKHLAGPVIHALNDHVDKHLEDIVRALSHGGYHDFVLLRPVVEATLDQPRLALRGFSDVLAVMLGTHLHTLASSSNDFNAWTYGADSDTLSSSIDSFEKAIMWSIQIYVVCAVCQRATQRDTTLPDALSKLHSTLLLLERRNKAWRWKIYEELQLGYLRTSLALALNSAHRLGPLPTLVGTFVQESKKRDCMISMFVPSQKTQDDYIEWYRCFTIRPDEHFKDDDHRSTRLYLSEIVTFEEAVERMKVSSHVPLLRLDTNRPQDESGVGQDDRGGVEDGDRGTAQDLGTQAAEYRRRLFDLLPFGRGDARRERDIELA